MNAVESLEVASLIPHCGESVLLDRIVEHDGESTTSSIIVGSQSWLVREDGSVAPWLTVEYMAQSIALHEGIVAVTNGRELPLGFLVSVVALDIRGTTLQRGERLEVRTTRVRGRPGLGVLSHCCTLHRRGAEGAPDVIAEGRL
ncbi:MAG: hypothetical protein JRE70_01895, partial [Deltaproteobacteria bacterium]|nr:hypothetical protein [Deltaproteobacteria bacterium]